MIASGIFTTDDDEEVGKEKREKKCPKIYDRNVPSFRKSDESKMWFLVVNVNDVQQNDYIPLNVE